MAQDVAPLTLAGDIGDADTELDGQWTALDAGINRFGPIHPGRGLIILIRNPTGGALSFHLVQTDNRNGRSANTTSESLGAGEQSLRGPFTRPEGWASTTGNLGVQVSVAAGLEGVCFIV